MNETGELFEHPETDPLWMAQMSKMLEGEAYSFIGTFGGGFRYGVRYTPYESVDALGGWLRHPGQIGMSERNWRSLADDVSAGLEALTEVLGDGPLITPVSELIAQMRSHRGTPFADPERQRRLSNVFRRAKGTLGRPDVAGLVWDKLHRRFAREQRSAWSVLPLLVGVLQLAGHSPMDLLFQAVNILRDNVVDPPNEVGDGFSKAGLPIPHRLNLIRKAFTALPVSGPRICWLLLAPARCPMSVVQTRSVTFYDGSWWLSVFELEDFERHPLPSEVMDHLGLFGPDRFSKQGFDHDAPFVLARVDLGQGFASGSEAHARSLVQRYVYAAKLWQPSQIETWTLASGAALFLDGRLLGHPRFSFQTEPSRQAMIHETVLYTLQEAATEVDQIDDEDPRVSVLLEAIGTLNNLREAPPGVQLRTTADTLEGLLRVLEIRGNPWVEWLPQLLGPQMTVLNYRAYLANLVIDAFRSTSDRGIVDLSGAGAVFEDWDRVNLEELPSHFSDVLSWLEPSLPLKVIIEREFDDFHRRRLRQSLQQDLSDYTTLTRRAARVRNALAHGGYVEPGGLDTAAAHLRAGAAQLAVEILQALAVKADPLTRIKQLSARYKKLIETSNDDPRKLLTCNPHKGWPETEGSTTRRS